MAGLGEDERALFIAADSAGADGPCVPQIVQSHEQTAVVPLEFPQAVIQRVIDDFTAGDITDAELRRMHGYDGRDSLGVAGLSLRISRIRQSDSSDDDHVFRKRGFAVAHRVLDYAVGSVGLTLPAINDERIRDYEVYMRENPDLLSEQFYADYERHGAVTSLVEKFGQKASQEGAMMAFVLFGHLANPTRAPLNIPPRTIDATQGAEAAEMSRRLQDRRATRRRTANVTGSRPFKKR
jgi:hypothetical protein